MESIPTKDIALAVMGGSAAIASMLLVFVGFMMMKIEGLPSSTSQRTVKRYKLSTRLGLIPMVVEIAAMISSYLWLFHPTSVCLFRGWSIGFVAGLFLFAAYAIYVTLRL